MAKMGLGFSFILFAFICGLLPNTAHTKQVDSRNVTVDRAIYEKHTISCRTSAAESRNLSVTMLQILKMAPEKKPTTMAHIIKGGKAEVANDFLKDVEGAFGFIDGGNSVLNVTFPDETKTSYAWEFECVVYYTDSFGEEQEVRKQALQVADATIKSPTESTNNLEDLKAQIIRLKIETTEKMEKQAAQYDDLKKTVTKLIQQKETPSEEFGKQIEELKMDLVGFDKKIKKIINGYNAEFDKIYRKSYVTQSALNTRLESLEHKLNGSTLRKIKSLEKKQNTTAASLRDDLVRHEEIVENVTKQFAKKDRVDALEKRVTRNELLIGNHSSQIALLKDQVSVLNFLVQPQTEVNDPVTTKIPKTDPKLGLLSKVDTLVKQARNQTQQIDFLLAKDFIYSTDITDLTNVTRYLRQTVDESSNKVTAFSASLKKKVEVKIGRVIVFNDVKFNKGQGYDGNKGVFTAPRSGIYGFNLVFLSRKSDEWIDLDIQVNNKTPLVRLTSKEKDLEDQRAASVVTPLSAGDEVKVVVKYTSSKKPPTAVVNLNFSVFSGYFLQPL